MSVIPDSRPPPPMRELEPGRLVAATAASNVAGPSTVARQPKSLVISPNLDALLEHDERMRRAARAHGRSGSISSSSTHSPGAFATFPDSHSPIQALPPPPRRPRLPTSPSPLSPGSAETSAPGSPVVATAVQGRDQEDRAETPTSSVESNPYINPAPQFEFEDELPPKSPPISPPPRSSSMGIMERGRTRGGSLGGAVVVSGDVEDRSSGSVDSRPSPPPRTSSLLPAKRSSLPKEPAGRQSRHTRSRSRGKLVKTREPGSPLPTPTATQPPTPTPTPQHTMAVRRPRSSHSVASSDRESFIDFDPVFSPSNQDFPDDLVTGPFAAASPASSSFPRPPKRISPAGSVGSPKPPVPTTPKPDFTHLHLQPGTRRSPPAAPPPSVPLRPLGAPPDSMPPTTNFLNPSERSLLVRKSRKLAQVFGQTPGAGDIVSAPDSSFLDVAASGTGSAKLKAKARHRPAASMNIVGQMPASSPRAPWPAPDKTIYMTVHGRRHSNPTPSSPSDEGFPVGDMASDAPSSPHSFMDLSASSPNSSDKNRDTGEREIRPDDSISVADTVSVVSIEPAPRQRRPLPLPPSPSSVSFYENPEAQADEERRRRRDKLAKLHRFLGSRVPASLVLGPGFGDAPLPPAVVTLDGTIAPAGDLGSGMDTIRSSRSWMQRRRSSSAAVLESAWSDDLDRIKENLNDKEKAIIVRRAQKMEKVFGVAPPQGLYSAHHSGSGSPVGTFGTRTAPTSPMHTPPASPPISGQTPSVLAQRNPNQAAYKRAKSGRRPRTGDSGEFLITHAEPSAGVGSGSFAYNHYQHSLNSLHDIIDRNDQESLAELQQYLNDPDADPDDLESPPATASSSKVERRRSMPTLLPRASMASLVSVSTVTSDAMATTPDAATSEFQTRRRRAAKLTQFFGVDYRDLIEDVLESIEVGLNAERSRGTLNQAEADALLQKLRTLKTKRT